MGSADRTSAAFAKVLLNQRPTRPTVNGPQQATIVSATADGCYFTIPSFSATIKYGPAPYPRAATDPTIPEPGTACLVVFATASTEHPWVLVIDWAGTSTPI